MQSKILRLPEVIKKTGLSRSTIYALMAQHKFPRRVSLGIRCIGWLEGEVDDWIDSRAAIRNQ